jgi:Bacteriophage baseplate protein W
MSGPFLDFPLGVDGSGRMATSEADDHTRDLIEQVLFTSPGERPNRPDFGCGLAELVFEPNSVLLAAAVELRVRGSLQRWLGDVIDVEDVRVDADDSRLTVDVTYVRLLDGTTVEARFPAPGEAP